MSEPKFQIGDDLYVREPTRYERDVISITGRVTAIGVSRHDGSPTYHLDAYVSKIGGGFQQPTHVAERDVGLRLGTPINQLSGRVNEPGYEAFKGIALSWGYD
ncbi:hypothetical protein [Phenylobacterium sp.]|uniref:hypothetical protein n=1 Tax=Phenylobacterium sp. TaxID=1871053 RepID=UPI002737CA6B|nr:hypothetical protein [Phenylobacterium sp.]MDP3869213.1 hypothetical protein [Phenylobacterium sp.]